jgi:hypothetical protein
MVKATFATTTPFYRLTSTLTVYVCHIYDWKADRQILDDRLHTEGLGQIQVISSQIRLALSTQSPASRDLQGVRREQSRNKESEMIEAEWTASRDAGLRMPIPLFGSDTPDPKMLRLHARFCLRFRSASVPTVVATAIMRLSPARCHGRGGASASCYYQACR